jgi:hypothetical protein
MGIKFTSKEKRDELAHFLAHWAVEMIRCRDQGRDGKIIPTDDLVGAIQTAAAVVSLADVDESTPLTTTP